MKLYEITSFILNEIFDTVIPVDKWELQGPVEIGVLYVGTDEYRILFEKFEYDVNGALKNGLNIAFEKWINGEYSQKLALDNSSASKILGAIYNACLDKLKKTNYDAIIFVAVDNTEKRMNIYNAMARRLIKILPDHGYVPDIKIPNGVLTIVFDGDKWTPEEMNELKARASK